MRELLHKHLHIFQAAVAIAVIQFRESAYEDKLIAVLSQREAFFRQARVSAHLAIAVTLKGQVGGSVERIFHLLAEAGVFLEIGIGEQYCPLVIGELFLQPCHIARSQVVLTLARVQQEHVVIDVGHLLELWEFGQQARQLLLTEGQVVQFVLEHHARVVESVLNDEITGCHLLLGEGNLRQIVLALVRVVLRTVIHLFQRVLNGLLASNGVEHFLRHLLARATHAGHHGLIYALPVVHVLAFSPHLLKRLLTLLHGHRVVEVPLALLLGIVLRVVGRRIVAVAHRTISLHGLLSVCLGLITLFFLFLFLQGLNDTVDGSIAVFLTHLGQCLQRVLQMHGIGIRHQFIKHL